MNMKTQDRLDALARDTGALFASIFERNRSAIPPDMRPKFETMYREAARRAGKSVLREIDALSELHAIYVVGFVDGENPPPDAADAVRRMREMHNRANLGVGA